jgi:hypothetical protein
MNVTAVSIEALENDAAKLQRGSGVPRRIPYKMGSALNVT